MISISYSPALDMLVDGIRISGARRKDLASVGKPYRQESPTTSAVDGLDSGTRLTGVLSSEWQCVRWAKDGGRAVSGAGRPRRCQFRLLALANAELLDAPTKNHAGCDVVPPPH